MRATLVMNPKAGDGDMSRKDLQPELERRGDEIVFVSSKDDHLREALADPGELIVVAGGDGTVAEVVRLITGSKVPLLIVPSGTANNIATSLGIEEPELDLRTVRKSWRNVALDVADSNGEIIIEAAGCGAVAYLLHEIKEIKAEAKKGLKATAKALGSHIRDLPGTPYRVTCGDREWHGTASLIEVMNMPRIGPGLELAPSADPSDGLLDMVIVAEADHEALRRYLRSGGRDRKLPPVIDARADHFTIECDAPWHIDDEERPSEARTIVVRPKAWRAMLPRG
jgi:diacylglycerol kinase (ATP)